MDAQVKRYNVVIRGRVQDIGFRDLVAQMANFLRLRGYIFNDIDGSVRVIIEGAADTLDSFLEEIRIKTSSVGADIGEFDKREVSLDVDLPPRFVKIPTTELEELGRKLDIGIGKLDTLDVIAEGLGSIDGKLDTLDTLDILAEGQEKMNKTQEKMLKVLEKIGEK